MSGEARPNTTGEFLYRDIVQIVGQPDRISQPLDGKSGFIVGCSELDSPGSEGREYAVHVNDYQETFTISRTHLRGTGVVSRAEDTITRSRLGQRLAHRA